MSYSFISCGHHLSILITVLVITLTERGKIPHLNFFAMITLYHELSERFCYNLTTAIRQITNIHAALHRIQGFLEIDDFPNLKNSPENPHHLSTETVPDTIKSTKISSKCSYKSIREQRPYLSLHEVTCELPAQVARLSREKTFTEILNDVSFNVTTPGLVLVCGPVGSGKSSLLATILGGEQIVTSGLVKYSGTLAYVSDIPWVFPGTIRENILFGLPYNEKLYAETIRACQLEKDFKEFPQMDLALIGEHGATLSGGQRTRIALARAVYSQADIYLLDDPLSSLDAQVAENVFRLVIHNC